MRFLRRTIIAVILIAVIVQIVFLPPIILVPLVLLWIFMASREFTALMQKLGVHLPALLLPLANLIFPVSLMVDFAFRGATPDSIHLSELMLPCAVVCLYGIFARPPRAPQLGYAVFGIIYLSFLPAHLIMIRYLPGIRPMVVLFPLLATWVNDTGAYGFGRWLGRHKLTPISPNKTWEGFIAGVIVTVAFSVIYLRRLMPSVGLVPSAVLGLVLGVIAQAGDLVESIFKREAGVKDSSSALSEHGGFLDRADSLLFTLPAFYYFFTFLVSR
jgi:phosphatidate cytidylyltransferase